MSKLDQLRALREAGLKSSRGGGERRPARWKGTAEPLKRPRPEAGAGVAPGPREAKSRPSGTGHHEAAKPDDSHSGQLHHARAGTKSKGGRPRIEDRLSTLRSTKPWVELGMSERTWYRRQAEQRAKAKQ